jgi:hypothetical protein
MAARDPPQMIEEEREWAEGPNTSSRGAHKVVQRPGWRRVYGS